MITSKDLMIGDWVLINGTPRKVQAIDGVDDESMADDELYTFAEDRYCSEDKVEGVPLTEEILKKNGFSLDEYGEWYEREVSVKERNYWVNVAFRNDGVSVYDLDILTGGRSSICIHKNYVHELQHALRLCQIEKEIEL